VKEKKKEVKKKSRNGTGKSKVQKAQQKVAKAPEQKKRSEKIASEGTKEAVPRSTQAEPEAVKEEESKLVEGKTAKKRKPYVGSLKNFAKKQAKQAWPEIVTKIVDEAKGGSIHHAKFLVDVAGAKDAPKPRKSKAVSFADELRGQLVQIKKSDEGEPVTEASIETTDGSAVETAASETSE
jgi:hypothetical protein